MKGDLEWVEKESTIRDLGGFKIVVESDMEKYRADTFLTKEPETLEWIRSFSAEDILYDIGANIGIYSLYAMSLNPKMRIFAFEPDFNNYIRLIQNIALNNYPIFPIYAGIGNVNLIAPFFLKKNDGGASGGQFHRPIDEAGKEFKPEGLINVPIFTLWDFIGFFKALMPNHIKIDVDGQEENIFPGMLTLLPIQNLKSFLIEFNERTHREWIKEFKRFGFTNDNRFNKYVPHSRERRLKEGIKAENIIFTR